MKKFNINCEVYKTNLSVWIGGTEKEFVAEANKLNAEMIEDGCSGCYVAIGEKDSPKVKARILWVEKYPKTIAERAILVHEILHAVLNILSYKNIRLITNNENVYFGTSEEPFAYMLEFFYREIFNKLKLRA